MALAARMSVVIAIRNALTAAIVGSTCRLRLFQMRTGSVWARTPARNSEISNSSKEARTGSSRRGGDGDGGRNELGEELVGATLAVGIRPVLVLDRPLGRRVRAGERVIAAFVIDQVRRVGRYQYRALAVHQAVDRIVLDR
jgi:hypothetical protein